MSRAQGTQGPSSGSSVISKIKGKHTFSTSSDEITTVSTMAIDDDGKPLRFKRNISQGAGFVFLDYFEAHKKTYETMTNLRIIDNYAHSLTYKRQMQSESEKKGYSTVSIELPLGDPDKEGTIDEGEILRLTQFARESKADQSSASSQLLRAETGNVKWHTYSRFCAMNSILAGTRHIGKELDIKDITNALADRHGLKREFGLMYIIYTPGLEYCFYAFPMHTTALVAYRFINAKAFGIDNDYASNIRKFLAQKTEYYGSDISVSEYMKKDEVKSVIISMISTLVNNTSGGSMITARVKSGMDFITSLTDAAKVSGVVQYDANDDDKNV